MAADTCSHDRGSLAAKTIERCVSSHQWLVQGVKPSGLLEVAQRIISDSMKEKAYKEEKIIPDHLKE